MFFKIFFFRYPILLLRGKIWPGKPPFRRKNTWSKKGNVGSGIRQGDGCDFHPPCRAETSAPRPPPKTQELGSKKKHTANKTVQAWNPRAARNRVVLNKARRFQRPTPIYITFIYILDLDLFLKDWIFNVFCLVILYFSKLDFQSSNHSKSTVIQTPFNLSSSSSVSSSARFIPMAWCVAELGWKSSNNWNFVASPVLRNFRARRSSRLKDCSASQTQCFLGLCHLWQLVSKLDPSWSKKQWLTRGKEMQRRSKLSNSFIETVDFA